MNYARICRYFQLNLLIARGSIGINCYSPPPRKRAYSKFQHISHLNFQYLFFEHKKRSIYISIISISLRYDIFIEIIQKYIKSWLLVSNIFLFISMHTRFLWQFMDARKRTFTYSLLLLKKFHTILNNLTDRKKV